jgi:L-ribulose-5-phosphate 3-epimerase
MTSSNSVDRRSFLGAGVAAAAMSVATGSGCAFAGSGTSPGDAPVVVPPAGKRILLSCKLSMIANEDESKALTLVDRLKLAGQAGFDGVDFDEAGKFTVDEARKAVRESGVFAHNAINHDHWKMRLTSGVATERATSVANVEHCLRVSHAIGGSAVLIVIGHGNDGTPKEIDDRAAAEIKKLIPLAASLGQSILFENVWNHMHYDHDAPPDQTPERFIQFVDRFNSPWVGMYYDIGNHWKYGQPRQWLNAFGRRAVKLDVKGFSRANNKFVDIGCAEDDLPWGEVRKGLTVIRKQMQTVFGLT